MTLLLLLLNVIVMCHGFTISENQSIIQAQDDPRPTNVADWPAGVYGLPKPTSGCPSAGWEEGYRYQDCEDKDDQDSWSDPIHLAGHRGSDGMGQEFCIKPNFDGVDWPKGEYCIYRSGDFCPEGLYEGEIYMDDEDSRNKNEAVGTLPAGSYGENTKYYYCCHTDGSADTEITLPTTKEFFLFPHTSSCQKVSGMSSSMEYLHFDTNDHNDNSYHTGYVPKVDGTGKNPTIYYCYYTPT